VIGGELVAMLKILEPFWNRASLWLGCRAAPLKKGSRISKIPANVIHCADHHRTHRLSRYRSYFYAFSASFFSGRNEKLSFHFPLKKPKMFVGQATSTEKFGSKHLI